MANEQKMIPFTELATADLFVDAVYESAGSKIADDPLPRLLQVSNMGGFRYRGALADLELVVLTSTLSDPDWPDELDRETGVFTYYGDNKKPGRALHATPRNGNELLRRIFAAAHFRPHRLCSSARRPASVILTRATSIICPPAPMRSACAVASPARGRDGEGDAGHGRGLCVRDVGSPPILPRT
jgi:Restriction endonuclease AspBHI N-terminal